MSHQDRTAANICSKSAKSSALLPSATRGRSPSHPQVIQCSTVKRVLLHLLPVLYVDYVLYLYVGHVFVSVVFLLLIHDHLIHEVSLLLVSRFDDLQDVLSVRGGVGQLHAQLPAPEPCHAIRRENLHHSVSVPGGKTCVLQPSHLHSPSDVLLCT